MQQQKKLNNTTNNIQRMVTNDGWVKLFRKTRQWEWYKVENMFHLFCHLLMGANQIDGLFRGNPVKRGQLITGFNSLSADTGITIRALRTCLERLKKSGEISIKTTNKFSIITICKYEEYNGKSKKSDTPNDKQSDTQSVTPPTGQTTTNKNTITYSNSKEEKEEGDADASYSPPRRKKFTDEEKAAQVKAKEDALAVRKKKFLEDLKNYAHLYSPTMMNAFYLYWTEQTIVGYKMKWELNKTWETRKRLATWSKKEWNKPAANPAANNEMDTNLEKILREDLQK